MLLATPSDAKAVVHTIRLLNLNLSLRHTLGSNARADFVQLYAPQAIVSHMLSNLEKCQLF